MVCMWQDGGGAQPESDNKQGQKADDDAVEMKEDFEGAMEDLPERPDERSSDSEEESEDEMDKKMGELDGEGSNGQQQLDKTLWAPEADKTEEVRW